MGQWGECRGGAVGAEPAEEAGREIALGGDGGSGELVLISAVGQLNQCGETCGVWTATSELVELRGHLLPRQAQCPAPSMGELRFPARPVSWTERTLHG